MPLFILLAVIAFALGCFDADTLGDATWVEVGLLLFALHFAVEAALPFVRRRDQ